MAQVLIRGIPAEIHDALKARAAAHRRSLSREVLVILERAVREGQEPAELSTIDALRVKGKRRLTQKLLDEARQIGRP